MRFSIGIAILLVQVAMMGIARVHPMRYYSWAPFDSQNEYRIEVWIDGRQLTPHDTRMRYRIVDRAVNPRAIYEILSLVEYVESRYRPHERAIVHVTYRTNGSEERVWRWPQS